MTKTCCGCKEEKFLTEFGKDKNKKSGIDGRCKACKKVARKQYCERYPERIKEQTIRYYSQDKEKSKAKSRQWRLENKEAVLKREKGYRASLNGSAKSLIQNAAKRSLRLGLECELDWLWVVDSYHNQNGSCSLTNIPFQLEKDELRDTIKGPFRMSIDRINPKIGYTKENSRLVCVAINLGLNEFGEDVFERIASAFLEKRKAGSPTPGQSITPLP